MSTTDKAMPSEQDDNIETTDPAEPTIDEIHNDPKADLLLLSNDNVMFRVNSHYLKRVR
jgi:hypothetical protein